MKTVILAGGFGTRLYSVTQVFNKLMNFHLSFKKK